jgi:PAS domain S-box-containing protein
MQLDEQEEKLLRSVALQNAQAVLFAREKAERELLATREALKASNHQITSILERISDGFAALDNNSRFTFLNHKCEEIFQRLKKEETSFLGKNLWQEFPGLVGSEIEQHYHRAVRDQVTVEFETHLKPLNAWYIIRIYPSADGVSLYFLDVSRRKNTEAERARSDQALKISEQHFRAAFNQAAVGMGVASLDGRLEEVNDRYAEILGYSREELLKLTFMDFTFPEDKKITLENVRKLLSGEIKEYNYEKRYLRKDGSIVWGLTSVTLLFDQAGKPDRFIGVLDDITLRKQAEERIREAAERLQLALTAGQLGDWSWDARTDLVTFGPDTAEIFGLPPKTSITWKALRDLLHEEDREPARVAVEQALASHSDYSIEYRVRHSGGLRWVASKARGVYAPDGSVLGMIGVAQDISDRRDSEELRSRLAAVVESSDDAIITMTLDAIISTWNKGAERTFGYSAAEVVGQTIHKLLPADRQDEESLILGRIIKGERVEHYETIRAHKNGHLIDVSLTVSPIFDANNKLIGFSKISRDISARKRVQQALEEESRVLEVLNETGRAIASELDLNKVVQIVTDSATRLSGAKFGAFFYNVTDQNGESFMLYTLSGANRADFEKFGHPRATPLFGPTFRGEGIIRIADVRKDPRYGQWGPHHGMPKGHLPVVSYLAVPVISRDGRVIGGLFFAHPEPDIFTERAERLVAGVAAQAAIALDNASLYDAAQHEIDRRKITEEQLRDAQATLCSHAENLETLVAERTAKLRDTIGELEAFSYSVSHDMRSPLRAMNGYSDALLEEYGAKLDDTGRDYLQRIKRAASRMDLLIQDVLAYSRVAQGDVPLKPVDLNTVIHDVIQHYPSLQSDRAHITIQPNLPLVIGHEAYLTQAVSNILTNGVKFVPPGTFPFITITAQTEDGHVRVFFKDNGIGIAAEHRSRIFQIFGRVYSEKQYEGTGIGLAIAKKAAERMGGSIGVESELGRGSCFYLILKAAS